MKSIIIFTLTYLLSFHIAHSQEIDITEYAEVHALIILNSGDLIDGYIIEWSSDEKIKLKLDGISDILTIEQSEIKKIYPKSDFNDEDLNTIINKGLKPKASYNFNDQGIYYSARVQMIVPNDGDRANGVFGFGMSVSAGHKFSRLFSLGAGFGYDQYIWNSGEELIPVFAEVSGYITPTNTSLYYNLQTGYSFALSDDQYGITEATGGLMVYPAIGIRFGKEIQKFSLDVGYKFQKANYTYRDIWTSTTFHDQSLHYKRMSVRFSIIL